VEIVTAAKRRVLADEPETKKGRGTGRKTVGESEKGQESASTDPLRGGTPKKKGKAHAKWEDCPGTKKRTGSGGKYERAV